MKVFPKVGMEVEFIGFRWLVTGQSRLILPPVGWRGIVTKVDSCGNIEINNWCYKKKSNTISSDHFKLVQ